jgi:hypothetical protein
MALSDHKGKQIIRDNIQMCFLQDFRLEDCLFAADPAWFPYRLVRDLSTLSIKPLFDWPQDTDMLSC